MLGMALKTLPKELRHVEVCQEDVDRLINGQKLPFRIGFKIDENTYQRKWVAVWGNVDPKSVGVKRITMQVDLSFGKAKRVFDL